MVAPAANASLSGQWRTSWVLTPLNRNFPAGGLPAYPPTAAGNGSSGLPDDDVAAMLTGIYGSAAGCLVTAGGSGFAATTIDRPSYGYPGMFNFFDPDNFLTLSAVLGAGDPFLSSQVRRVLEQSGASISATGQVPHHFEYGSAVFSALSGATMPGPNSFWIRTCLRYAQYTGDLPWLRGYLPQMRHALGYLRSMVNSSVGLLRSSGSLFIDIFDRHGRVQHKALPCLP